MKIYLFIFVLLLVAISISLTTATATSKLSSKRSSIQNEQQTNGLTGIFGKKKRKEG